MKKIILLAAFFVSSLMFSQNAFDKLEGKEGIESIVVTKKMFEMMSKVKVDAKDKEMQQYMNLLKKLDNLQAVYTSNQKLTTDLNGAVSTYLKSNPLEAITTTTQDGNVIKVYGKTDANQTNVKEVLVVVNGNFNGVKTSVLSITGDFPLSEIALIVKKLNIPGADVIGKIEKK
ncbi:DUF4252 domain-containing protein [Flavobacterium urocaniciphilum]|uniref:DUF4252 domain-containing protein n=1 Tax=Flavobacterium urocaniciphilum TaxID=1299341 RepID=A0A1H8YW52_9FLAO|nr:DUF4252 domain-containing protein [Flavobacterium urocaniciphilum]SEP56352.1 protein of unknown function [Flavobacterium urocaniciphilum]